MKKGFSFLFGLILIFISSFYFWGSSSTLSSENYNEIYSTQRTYETKQRDTFSIVTFNIGYLSGMTNNKAMDRTFKFYKNNLNHAIETYQNLNVDFAAFQEIDFDAHRSFSINQMDTIAKTSNFPFWAKAVNWDKTYVPFPYWPISQQFGKIVSGQAILSHFPIVSNEILTFEKPEKNPFYYNAFYLDRLAQITTIKIDSNELVIINVHLEAFVEETREKQIQAVLEKFQKYVHTVPVILCGDFNSTPPGATNPWQKDSVIHSILTLQNIKMAISLEENFKNEKAYYTFNSETPDRRIDYFFYNPKFIQVLDTRVVSEANQISDHLPVWMKFVIK